MLDPGTAQDVPPMVAAQLTRLDAAYIVFVSVADRALHPDLFCVQALQLPCTDRMWALLFCNNAVSASALVRGCSPLVPACDCRTGHRKLLALSRH
jgi:hypothetical protein